MENKYYTPDIEDVRVGYECEIKSNHGYESFSKGEEHWHPVIISFKEKDGGYGGNMDDILIGIDDGYQPVRTPYLTKEQIESEGWTLLSPSENTYTKGYLGMAVNFEKHILAIGDRENRVYFNGKCLSINELRYITKLLKI